MKNQNKHKLIIILINLFCQVSYICASDQCELCNVSSKSLTLPIHVVCGVCGRQEREQHLPDKCDPTGVIPKVYNDDEGCHIMESHCEPYLPYYKLKCTDRDGSGSGCIDLFRTDVRCGCKEGYFGNYCVMKTAENFIEPSDGWVLFDNHQYKWKSRLFITTLFLAQTERFDIQPAVTYRIRMPAGVYIPFTKYRKTLTEDNYKSWCLTSTSLGEYCTRFNLIFDSEYHEGEKVKRIFYFEAEMPFYDEDDRDIKYQLYKYYYNNEFIGYNAMNRVDVWYYYFDPTYFPVTADIIGKVGIYRKDDSFSFINYTSVDRACIPRFSVAPGCTDLRNAASTYYVSEDIAVTMNYIRPPPGCQESSYTRWRCWKVGYDIYREEGSEDLSYDGCCTWTFPTHSLWEGVYTVQFRMKHFKGGETFSNIKGCLIRVELRPLQGGFVEAEKYVNTEDLNTIIMEAKDINRAPDLQRADFEYTWSCTYNDTEEMCPDVQKYFRNAPSFDIPIYTLNVNWTYHFTVKAVSRYLEDRDAQSIKHLIWAYQTWLVGTELEPISLICISCDDYAVMSPTELNYVAVRARDGVSQPKKQVNYIWDYAEEGVDTPLLEYKPVDSIREVNGTSRLLLKIKKNSLGFAKTYVFRARVPDSQVHATVKVRTSPYEFKLTCTVSPEEGIRGWTDFSIQCLLPPKDELVLYEFYDKDLDDQHLFSGRMLGYNGDGNLEEFKMTKGKLVVLFYDAHNSIIVFEHVVKLEPFNDTLQYLEGVVDHAEFVIDSGRFDKPTSLVSSVADVIEQKMNPKSETIRKPLYTLEEVPLKYLSQVKMCLSSLNVILTNIADKFEFFEIEADLVKMAADLLMDVTLAFVKHEETIRIERSLTQLTYLDMARVTLDCIEVLLMQKNREVMSKPEEYVNPFLADLVYETSSMLVSMLEIISFSMDRQQVVGDQAQEIVTRLQKIFSYTKVDFLEDMSNWTMTISDPSIIMSSYFIHLVGHTKDITGLQYMRLKINPFWWVGSDIVTEVLFVQFCLKMGLINCRLLTNFHQRLVLHLNVTEPLDSIKEIAGTTYQLNSKMSEEYLDLGLTVYRFFLPQRAKLFLKFIINETEEYRVLLVDGLRPDYAMVVEHAVIINSSSPDYDLFYDNKHDYEKIYYMGILPSDEVAEGESVSFRLRAFYSLCMTWATWQWTSYGCWVGENTDESSMQCDCDHLSLITGVMTTPDHDLNPAWEFLLYLTPWGNLLPLLVMIFLILLCLLFLIWGLIRDRKDKIKGDVIVLEDNFPGERYAYLIGVYTGSRLFSGTSAIVGVRLYGDRGESRSHILRSSERTVTSSFSEDWFLLYCPMSLGKIEHMLLWHNSKGSNPDWFVDKIEVYDLNTKLQYIFEIKQWIGIEVDSYPLVSIVPLKVHQFFRMRNVFHYNFVNGLMDTNIWTSVYLKHPRNPVSRVERISVVLCFILVAMAVSLLLYLSHFGFDIDEDKPSYYFSYVDLLIFMLTFLVASVVACLLIGLFRKSFTHKYKLYMSRRCYKVSLPGEMPNDPRTIRYMNEDEFFQIDANEVKRFKSMTRRHVEEGFHRLALPDKPRHMRSTWENSVMALYKITRGNFLLPVKLPSYKSDLIVRKPWFVAAWIACILTIAISVLIICAYAWKLPTVKNEKFLVVFLGVVLFDAIIVSLLKIILSSAILSYMFQHLVPATTYHIRPKDGTRRHLIGDIPFLAKLLEVREQNIYFPLPSQFVDEKIKKKIRIYRWRILIDFLMCIVLTLVVLIICKGYAINKYETNRHVTRMTTAGHKSRVPSLEKVFNRTEFHRYLQYIFVNQIFRYMWYNFDPLIDPESQRKDWTDDCVIRLLGNTRMRQLRVMLRDCESTYYFENRSDFCAPSWSNDAEDKDVYSTGWLLGDYKDTTRKITAWRYTSPDQSNSSNLQGRSGKLYHGGGYIAELGYMRRQTRVLLSTLEKVVWLDHMTRVVFVELNLYNVNTNLLTQVVLVAEQEPTGEYITVPVVDSVKIIEGYNIWEFVFIIFLVFFLCRMIYLMNRRGIFVYLSNKLHKYELFLLILGFGAVILYFVHMKTSSYYVQQFQRRGLDEFFSFFKIIQYYDISKTVMCFLFFFLVAKLLFCWKFGEVFFAFYYTLLLSLAWILRLTIYFSIILIIMWRFILYRLNVFLFSHYSFIIIYPKGLYKATVHEGTVANVFVYFMCIGSSFVILMLIASFSHYYRIGKYYKPLRKRYIDKFNYIVFFKDEITNTIKKGKKGKKSI